MPKYFNTTNGPVTIDSDCRIVGGGEWFENKKTPQIETALERGDLVVVTTPKNKEDESEDSSKTAGNKGA